MSIAQLWVGRTTEDSAQIKAEVSGSSVRLVVSEFADFSEKMFFGPASPASHGIVTLEATGLTPNSRFWYRLEIDGTEFTSNENTGRFRTHPPMGEPANFRIAAFSCAGSQPSYPGVGGALVPNRISNHPGFGNVLNRDPLQLVHLGDIAYYDLGSGNHGIAGGASLANFRRMFQDVFKQPNQAALYRSVATQHIYDDHDGGPNDHAGNSPSYPNAHTVYRERVPHYPLTAPGSLYQAWQVGRVQFVIWDVRSGRSPNSDPDTPDKTMLGASQKAAFEATLANSSAEALVLFNPSDWASSGGRADGWDGFTHDRDWVVSKLNQYGWSGKTVLVGGDLHYLALDNGANKPGGIPILQAAPMDSSDAGTAVYYNLGAKRGGRGQYGTVDVTDTGDYLSIRLTGWSGNDEWNSYEYVILDEGGGGNQPPPIENTPVPESQATPRPTIEMYACDLITGAKLAYLPGASGNLSRSLGSFESSTITVPLPLSGPLAHRQLLSVLRPAKTLIVAVINDVPAWSGIFWKFKEGTSEGLQLACTTPESYLDRRFTGSLSFNQVDQALIAAGLVSVANQDGINIAIDAPESGILRDRNYHDDEDATVYQRLQELMGVIDGPEWTIDTVWADEQQRAVKLVFRCYAEIGAGRGAPKGPLSTIGQAKAEYEFTDDWSKGHGANDVIATGSGEGEDRIQSVRMVDEDSLAAGYPRLEHRFSPSSSIKQVTTLNDHANAELEMLSNGTQSLEVSARWDIAPFRLGVDLLIGDWVMYDVYGPARPAGFQGVARMIGWKLEASSGKFSPVLLDY